MYKLLQPLQNQSIFWWLSVFIWAGLIFYLSSQPAVQTTEQILGDYLVKKLAHLFVYGVLYMLLIKALKPQSLQTHLMALVFCCLYGVSDELHQSFVPGRYPKLNDVWFDTLGAGLAHLKARQLI